jgi:hypothetical protein
MICFSAVVRRQQWSDASAIVYPVLASTQTCSPLTKVFAVVSGQSLSPRPLSKCLDLLEEDKRGATTIAIAIAILVREQFADTAAIDPHPAPAPDGSTLDALPHTAIKGGKPSAAAWPGVRTFCASGLRSRALRLPARARSPKTHDKRAGPSRAACRRRPPACAVVSACSQRGRRREDDEGKQLSRRGHARALHSPVRDYRDMM